MAETAATLLPPATGAVVVQVYVLDAPAASVPMVLAHPLAFVSVTATPDSDESPVFFAVIV